MFQFSICFNLSFFLSFFLPSFLSSFTSSFLCFFLSFLLSYFVPLLLSFYLSIYLSIIISLFTAYLIIFISSFFPSSFLSGTLILFFSFKLYFFCFISAFFSFLPALTLCFFVSLLLFLTHPVPRKEPIYNHIGSFRGTDLVTSIFLCLSYILHSYSISLLQSFYVSFFVFLFFCSFLYYFLYYYITFSHSEPDFIFITTGPLLVGVISKEYGFSASLGLGMAVCGMNTIWIVFGLRDSMVKIPLLGGAY